MDKSFEGLLFSVICHVALAILILNAKMPAVNDNHATEITLVEKAKAPPTKAHSIIKETDEKPLNEDIKKQADFLSQFTKRVKQQFVARNLDVTTRNAARKAAQQARQKAHQRMAGMESKDKGELDTSKAQPDQMTALNAGVSTIQTIIPGIEGASFTTLNTDQYTFYTFYNRTGEQIVNRWVPGIRGYLALLNAQMMESLSRRNRTTVVEAVLTPEGQIFKIIVQESSGDKGLDEIMVQAFREAAPFMHPPREMVKSDGFIHYYAAFTVAFRPPNFGPAG